MRWWRCPTNRALHFVPIVPQLLRSGFALPATFSPPTLFQILPTTSILPAFAWTSHGWRLLYLTLETDHAIAFLYSREKKNMWHTYVLFSEDDTNFYEKPSVEHFSDIPHSSHPPDIYKATCIQQPWLEIHYDIWPPAVSAFPVSCKPIFWADGRFRRRRNNLAPTNFPPHARQATFFMYVDPILLHLNLPSASMAALAPSLGTVLPLAFLFCSFR